MFRENKSWVIYYQVCYKNVLHVNHAVTLTGISCFKLKHEFGQKKSFHQLMLRVHEHFKNFTLLSVAFFPHNICFVKEIYVDIIKVLNIICLLWLLFILLCI